MTRWYLGVILSAVLVTACPSKDDDDDNGSSSTNTNSTPSASSCAADLDLCGGSCVNLLSNPDHCGACNNACDGACSNAVCQPVVSGPGGTTPGTCTVGEMCGGVCVDTNQNALNCGACGISCASGQNCVDGQCAMLGPIQGVLLETNQARAMGADCGTYGNYAPAAPLELDPYLSQAAQNHAQDMASNNYFSHTGLNGSSPWDRIAATGFPGQALGENIAAGQASSSEVVGDWVDSDGHCRNLMNSSATKIGVGYALGGVYGRYWVQTFGR